MANNIETFLKNKYVQVAFANTTCAVAIGAISNISYPILVNIILGIYTILITGVMWADLAFDDSFKKWNKIIFSIFFMIPFGYALYIYHFKNDIKILLTHHHSFGSTEVAKFRDIESCEQYVLIYKSLINYEELKSTGQKMISPNPKPISDSTYTCE